MSVPQITATLGESAPDTASATPSALIGPGLTASMPPEASRFAAKVERRQRRFVEVGIFVHTRERGAPVRDVVDPAVAHLGDLLGDKVAGLDEAAPLLDLPEMRPRLLGELLGEVLNEPRACRRIEHPPDMGLLQQQKLGVTGD